MTEATLTTRKDATVTSPEPTPAAAAVQAPRRRPWYRQLYFWVVVALVLGVTVGALFPTFGQSLKWVGTLFIDLIKMMIQPIIFCTLVLGIGSVRKAASVGRVGGLALGYFLVMSTFALAIGLLVGNIVKPGEGIDVTASMAAEGVKQADKVDHSGLSGFVLSIVPDSLFSALTSGSVLQTLLVALLVGFALQALGPAGEPVLQGIGHLETVVFKVMSMVMWVAPVGAFGAMAALVGGSGIGVLKNLFLVVVAFYVTCVLFVFGVLGLLLWAVARVNVWRLLAHLGSEFLLILSTSSSETALPRLIGKMEHLGVHRSTVGIVVPTGYSFNLDGTAIYLTMASLFIAEAMDTPFSLGQQVTLLVFLIIASKGAAGVSGAGLSTLAGGLQSFRPDLLGGVGLVLGIDRFMSEARSLTNFAGNSIATVIIATWTRTVDHERMQAVLRGQEVAPVETTNPI